MVLRSYLTGSRYHPFARFGDDAFAVVQRALQNTFDSGTTEAASMPVRLDVKEDEKSFTVEAELPGLSEKEVDVTFDDGLLTIRGEKKLERDEKQGTWHVIERRNGTFARQITLPANIDADKIEAKFDKGVLTVVLPKLPEEQVSAKKIAIKSS